MLCRSVENVYPMFSSIYRKYNGPMMIRFEMNKNVFAVQQNVE